MSDFKENYSKYLETWQGTYGTDSGMEYVDEIEKAIDNCTKVFQGFMENNKAKDINYLKGDIAEYWHAETLKLRAMIKGDSNVFAEVPRNAGPVDINYGSKDIKIETQVKYYKTPEDTAKALSNPKYEGLEKIAPSDQLDALKNYLYKEYLRNLENRPEQANSYNDTLHSVKDHLEVNGIRSIPLTEQNAKELANDLKLHKYNPKEYGLDTKSLINFSDLAKQSSEAAVQAVIISVTLKAVPHLYGLLLDSIKNGEIDFNLLKEMGTDVTSDIPWNTLRAGLASFFTSSSKAGLFGESAKSLSPEVIGASTVLAINTIRNGFLLYRNDITKSEFVERCLRDTFIVSFAFLGSKLVQVAIPIPILGSLFGNFIGGMLGSLIYDNGNMLICAIAIEKEWTFFDFVNQDYEVPEYVLRNAGYDIFEKNTFNMNSFNQNSFIVPTFQSNSFGIVPLRRGLIGVRNIGYKAVE